MGRYRLSPAARDDLERIWNYGARRWGVEAADAYYLALFGRFADIAENPMLYQAVDDIREGYRRCVSGNDSIYYSIEGDFITIHAIIGRQDPTGSDRNTGA